MIRSKIFIAASLALLVGVSSADAQRRGGAAPAVARWSWAMAAPRGEARRRTARILRAARDMRSISCGACSAGQILPAVLQRSGRT